MGYREMIRAQEKRSVTVPSQTPSGVVFNSQPPNEPLPLGDVLNGETSLSMDNDFLELCLNEMSMLTPDHSTDPSPQNTNQECTHNSVPIPMDDPILDQFTDLADLIDSSLLSSLSFPLNPEPLKLPTGDAILDMDTPSSIVSMSSPLSPSTSADVFLSSPQSTSPSTPSDNTVSSCAPSPSERKRKSSSTEENSSKKTTEKYIERRKKNNVASQVSRARRRKRHDDLFSREKELEVQNAQLRVKVEEMSKEAERLKKLLINQLAH